MSAIPPLRGERAGTKLDKDALATQMSGPVAYLEPACMALAMACPMAASR